MSEEVKTTPHAPKVSVIVPVYKAEKYLRKCVDSILAQTFRDFEVLLVDDGSPDKSGEICDEYARKDPRVRVFHKENGGVSSARNKGIDEARGGWLVFIDSDDWITVDYLEGLAAHAKEGALYVCKGYYSNPKGSELWQYFGISNENVGKSVQEQLEKAEEFHVTNSPWIKLFSADVVRRNKIRFDERISLGEDHVFVLDYLLCNPDIQVIPETGYRLVRYGNSLSLSSIYKPSENLILYAQLSLEKRLLIAKQMKLSSSFVQFAYKEAKIYWLIAAKSLFAFSCKLTMPVRKMLYEKICKELTDSSFSLVHIDTYYAGARKYDAWIVPKLGFYSANIAYKVIFFLRWLKYKCNKIDLL